MYSSVEVHWGFLIEFSCDSHKTLCVIRVLSEPLVSGHHNKYYNMDQCELYLALVQPSFSAT